MNPRIIKYLLLLSLSVCFLGTSYGCREYDGGSVPTGTTTIKNTSLTLDKACYLPGETITITSDKPLSGNYYVRYRQLDETTAEEPVSGKTWTWMAPENDFTGYLAEVYRKDSSTETVIGSIGIDVSSDWTRFPRYGFLSDFGNLSQDRITEVLDNLNRHHINGLQYYDWHYDHHKPLAGTVQNPAASWPNISSTICYRSTINTYIKEAKARNMKSLFYNLCYGALNNAAQDGVKDEWYIFDDAQHTKKVTLYLSYPFKSNIYLLDPGNQEWLNYMTSQVADVYSAYDFDGYHIDQVGIHDKYDFSGKMVDLPAGFQTFINKMKASFPAKYHVFNAVGSYGQKKIAESTVDFQYYEVWNEAPGYADLKTILDNNALYSENKKNTVLAAYMNYNLAENKGTFNTPGVLMTEAVIFALGGAHIELGEHMLGKEYFPNGNLEMSPFLQQSMIAYYDFLVAYENLLRDSGSFNEVPLSCTNNPASLAQWPPQKGKVIALSKRVGTRQVVHLLNFTNAVHLNWCDAEGTQAEPKLIKSMPINLTTSQPVRKVWAATPDSEGSLYQELSFSQKAGVVSFEVPALKYWTMIVLDY